MEFLDKLLEDIENELNPTFSNQLKIEKIIEKYPSILKPINFNQLSSFGEMLSFLIYDAGCHYGLFKNCSSEENRFRFLNEKKRHFSEIQK